MFKKCKIVLAVLIGHIRPKLLSFVLIALLLMGLLPVSLPYPLGVRTVEATTVSFSQSAGAGVGVGPHLPHWIHNVNFDVNLPTGIRVTNAVLSVDRSFHGHPTESASGSFNGVPYSIPAGATIDRSWGSWQNVTHNFAGYNGGQQNFPFGISIIAWSGTYSVMIWGVMLQITYAFPPTAPTISSPVPGTRHLNSVNLAASSSIIGGGIITYTWEHSLNGVSWTHIGSTTGTLNWNIPGTIPLNSNIHVRAWATANGISSAPSTPVVFIRGTDPVEAARLAAEAALVAANEAAARAQTAINQTFFNGRTVAQMAHEIHGGQIYHNPGSPDHGKTAVQLAKEARDAANRDEILPAVSIGWSDKRTATRLNTEVLRIVASDNRTPLSQLRYEIMVNGATVINATGVPSSIPITIGATSGLRRVVVIVTDQSGNTAQAETQIWRL